MSLFDFLSEYDTSLLIALGEHLRLVAIALSIAVAIGVPVGAVVASSSTMRALAISTASVIQTIPSIALFGLMIPLLATVNRGIGAVPAVIALVLYAQLPIIRNTVVALTQLPAAAIDAARGSGMTERQILMRISLPLAVPGITAGVRAAATMSVGVAAVAAYIGAGGLGHFIARGIATSWSVMTLAGAIGVALVAVVIELALAALERLVTPRGIRRLRGTRP